MVPGTLALTTHDHSIFLRTSRNLPGSSGLFWLLFRLWTVSPCLGFQTGPSKVPTTSVGPAWHHLTVHLHHEHLELEVKGAESFGRGPRDRVFSPGVGPAEVGRGKCNCQLLCQVAGAADLGWSDELDHSRMHGLIQHHLYYDNTCRQCEDGCSRRFRCGLLFSAFSRRQRTPPRQ